MGTVNVANLSVLGSTSNERFPVVDETVLLNIVQVLKATISSEMNNLFSQLQTEMQKDRDLIQKLRENTSELTYMITTVATTIFIRKSASHPRGKELQRKLCLLPAIFNGQVMLKILSRVVVGFFVNSIHSGSQYSVLERTGVDFFSTLYFSIQAREKKGIVRIGSRENILELSVRLTDVFYSGDAENHFPNVQNEEKQCRRSHGYN